MTSQVQDAVARAKADIAELDRRINTVMTEEARLAQQRLVMERERDRIRAFVEMYQRYTELPPGKPAVIVKAPAQPKKARPRLVLLDRKPANIPPMSEMIETAIKEAVGEGRKGMEPREMTEFIRNKWWPNVKGESVSPIAWRMSKNGQLKKDGALYKLPS
jgi:hypothetical protein